MAPASVADAKLPARGQMVYIPLQRPGRLTGPPISASTTPRVAGAQEVSSRKASEEQSHLVLHQ